MHQAATDQRIVILLNSTRYDLLQSLLPYSAVNDANQSIALTDARLKQFTPQLRFLLQHLVTHSFPSLPPTPEFKSAASRAIATRSPLPPLFP